MDALSLAVDAAVALYAWNAEMPGDRPHPQSGNWGGVMRRGLAEGVVEVSSRPSGGAGLYLTGRDVAGRALAPVVLSSPDGQHHICCGCEDSDFLEDPAAESGSADAASSPASQGRSGPLGCSYCPSMAPDVIGLSMAGTTPLDMEELGFCSLACFILYSKRRWIDAPAPAEVR